MHFIYKLVVHLICKVQSYRAAFKGGQSGEIFPRVLLAPLKDKIEIAVSKIEVIEYNHCPVCHSHHVMLLLCTLSTLTHVSASCISAEPGQGRYFIHLRIWNVYAQCDISPSARHFSEAEGTTQASQGMA